MNMKLINRRSGAGRPLFLTLLALLAFGKLAEAQTFTYSSCDLCLGYRKVAPYTENNEVVVDLGQASDYVNAAIGTTWPVTGFSASQLVPGSFLTADDLSWAVFGSCPGPSANYPGYPAYTLWLTVPRADNAVRSPDASRYPAGLQNLAARPMVSILANAQFISQNVGASNMFNTATFVAESIVSYPMHLYSVWMGSLADNTLGTLNDNWTDNNLEIMTPDAFSGVVRSDLYEIRPSQDMIGNVIVDPHTGTNGLAYYVGYFEFSSDATMTFTREAATNPPAGPAPVNLSIGCGNDVRTISFLSSNSVTYKLCFTNAAGLSAPAASWPSLPGTISGDGTIKVFQDATTEQTRFYRVQEQ